MNGNSRSVGSASVGSGKDIRSSSVIKNVEYLYDFDLPNGKSYYTILCPFCREKVDVQKWSFVSQGKKCNCGALLRSWKARKLSQAHLEAMLQVRNGADVFSLETARLLREVTDYDGFAVRIVEPMGEYDGASLQPYFGAILSKDGENLLKRAVRKKNRKVNKRS